MNGMKRSDQELDGGTVRQRRRVAGLVVIAWSLVVGASLVWTLRTQRWSTNETARSQARAGFERDVLYRRWNAMHGGVYVPITRKTPPNPNLDVPNRDVKTSTGLALTLMNPAYMTRQVHELGAKTNGIQSHITSLKPIRPENAADAWERVALQALERGDTEYSSIEVFRGAPHLRLMRPLRMKKSCLKCHRYQGYREGDVGGGISISVPMAPLQTIGKRAMASAVWWYVTFWGLGLVGIGVFYRREATQATLLFAKEKRARESEQRFIDILHASDDAILLIDEGTFIDCNDASARLLGYSSRDELLMMHLSALSPPKQPDGRDSFDKAREMMRIAFEKGSHRFEWQHRKAGGEDLPIEVTLTAITYHDKSILHCSWRDLSRQKRAKEERDQSRNMMERILESMPVGVAIIGSDKIVRHVNSTALTMMGYESPDEILGCKCHQTLCPSQVCSCPIVDLGKTVDSAERVLINKDKKEISILKTAVPIVLNGENVLLETFIDITERKAAESELRKLSSAIEQTPAAVVVTDIQGNIEYVNPGFTQATGYTAEEAIGQNPRLLRSGVHSREFYQQMWETLACGKVWRGEICNRTKDGELLWEDATIAPVVDNHGNTLNFVAVKIDVSQRKRAEKELMIAKEEAEAANRVKSQFLSSMSHELRTPLTGILGFTDLLLGSDSGEAKRLDYLRTVRSSGQYLLELINDVLDLSRIEANRLEVDRTPCSPHGILSEIVGMMRAQAKAKSIDLRCRWSGPVPSLVKTDGARLRQILLNLVGNAVKFTQQGSVEVVARIVPSGERQMLVVDVTDSGIGIDNEKLVTIFEPFVQADNSVTRQFGGTGLGLAISARLARALGGDIAVASELGAGSTFTVSVDAGDLEGIEMLATPPADGFQARRDATRKMDAYHFQPKEVLLAEDGPINRKLISTVLEQAGLTVTTAENGAIALEIATDNDFDLILMDMQMPVLDGYAATRKLRDQGRITPIIALTAHAMKGDEERCLAAGCSHYVSKPIAIQTLLATVAEALGQDALSRGELPPGRAPQEAGPPLVSTLPTENQVFCEIVHEFVEYLAQLLAEMRQMAAAKNVVRLAELAHSLKGTAGTAGFDALTAPAKHLEILVNDGEMDAVGPVIDELAELAGRIVVPTETHTAGV